MPLQDMDDLLLNSIPFVFNSTAASMLSMTTREHARARITMTGLLVTKLPL
jgi:hypothetical protein